MNAHGERVVGTLRREVLDHLLIWNETHARHAPDAYARHHNRHRPHQARGQLPPLAQEHPAPKTDLTTHRVLRRRVLGGVINELRVRRLISGDEFPNGTGSHGRAGRWARLPDGASASRGSCTACGAARSAAPFSQRCSHAVPVHRVCRRGQVDLDLLAGQARLHVAEVHLRLRPPPASGELAAEATLSQRALMGRAPSWVPAAVQSRCLAPHVVSASVLAPAGMMMRVTVTVTVRGSARPWAVRWARTALRTRERTLRDTSSGRWPSDTRQRTSTCQPEPSAARSARTPASDRESLSSVSGQAWAVACARRWARPGCRPATPGTERAAYAAAVRGLGAWDAAIRHRRARAAVRRSP
ncbi:integrase core domain-containing protein [Streptomyces sp. JNUCC 63]